MIRSLARAGLEVYAGDHQKVFMSRYSRYTKHWFQYPHYATDPDGFIDSVSKYLSENRIGTYLPSHEEGFVVARNLDRFPDNVRIPISPYRIIDRLNSKSESQRLAQRLGIVTPETFSIRTQEELADRLHELPSRGVIKQNYSHGSYGVSFYQSREELAAIWNEETCRDAIIQQFVEGTIYTATVLAKEGTVHAHFARRNLREKEPFGGACVKCESVNFPKGLEAAKRIVKKIGYTGVAMFEFIVNEETENHWLMEVNPRYWGTSSHDFDSGINYPYWQYCLANSLPLPDERQYAIGLKSRWLAGDVISFFKHRQIGSDGHSLCRLLETDDDFFMDFKLDDPIPFLVQSWLYFKHRKAIFRTTN
jgi:predicted ATP-grasp superfamily ATP-dependent carboligase